MSRPGSRLAILRLLGDRRLRERLVVGGMTRVRGLGVERMVARTEDLYRSLVAGLPALLGPVSSRCGTAAAAERVRLRA